MFVPISELFHSLSFVFLLLLLLFPLFYDLISLSLHDGVVGNDFDGGPKVEGFVAFCLSPSLAASLPLVRFVHH